MCRIRISHHQWCHSDQQAQKEAHHKQPHTADQHGHKATERSNAQADAHRRLHAQLSVHHPLLVAQHEDDHRAEHEAGEEQHRLETSIAWRGDRKQMLWGSSKRTNKHGASSAKLRKRRASTSRTATTHVMSINLQVTNT